MSTSEVVFVTGSNTGLGYEIVKALYASSTQYEILMGTRSLEKGEAALQRIKSDVPDGNSNLSAVQADVESDASINQVVETITSRYGKLDCLINNAGATYDSEVRKGAMTLRQAWTRGWDTNVSGTHVLTNACVPLLLKSSNPRIIFMTSGTACLSETVTPGPHGARLNASPAAGWPKGGGMMDVPLSYRCVKTGLNMMMREWHRLLKNDGVKVWAVSPGFLATGLGGAGADNLRKMGALEPHLGGEFTRDVVQGKRDHDVGLAIRADMVQAW